MQLPETDTSSSGLYWAVEEYIVSSHVPPLTGTVLSQNPGIPVSKGNPSSYVRAIGNSSTPSAQPVRPEKLQFQEKGQNRNFGYKIVILVKKYNLFSRSRMMKHISPLESSREI